MQEDFIQTNQKKTRLRAPPRSVELVPNLDTLKLQHKMGEQKHYFYVRITLIITGLISLGLGIYILVKFDYFLSKNYDFKYHKLLLIFLYIYSPSAIGLIVLSFILSFIIYCFYCCCEKQRIYGEPLYDESEITMSLEGLKDNEEKENENDLENSKDNSSEKQSEKHDGRIKEEYIGINADKVTLLPYTMTIFVILTIAFYFIALPISIILLVKLLKHQHYKVLTKFWALYVFILANLINGILMIAVFLHMFFVKRHENSILKKNMQIDENKISEYRRIVREALKKPK